MNEALFLIAGFSLLLFLEKSPADPFSSPAREGIEIFLYTTVLLLFEDLAKRTAAPWLSLGDRRVLIFFLGAYLALRIGKKSLLFFLTLFSFTHFIAEKNTGWEAGPSDFFVPALGLAAGVSLLQFWMLGLKEKLLLAPIPKALAGLPISLFTASLLLLVLAGVFPSSP